MKKLQATSYLSRSSVKCRWYRDKLQANSGFTLIEMLLVIAMIAILASAILVAISAQREKARISKVVLELSGAIQPIMMCYSDGGNVNDPSGTTGGNQICSLASSYGTWPDLSGIASYNLKNINSSSNWEFGASVSGNNIVCDSDTSKCEAL